MANLTEYLTEKYNKMIGEIASDLGRQTDKLIETQQILRALKNPDILIAGAPLTLERLQVLENGDVRILPPAPVPVNTCSQEAPKAARNGKKDAEAIIEAEVVNAA